VVIDQWQRNGSNDLMRAGIAGFAHLPTFMMNEDGVALAHDSGIFFISTLSVYESFSRRRLSDLSFLGDPLISKTKTPWDLEDIRADAKRSLTADEQSQAVEFSTGLKNAQHNAKRLYDDGILLAAGTDAPYPGDFQGEGIHRELELLVEAGLTPLQAISVATSNASRLVGAEAEWGTLEAGKLANLVVVDGRPDQTIHDSRKIRYVINRGAIVNRDSLTFDAGTDPGFRPAGSSASN
jgi:imidazolonepropionase-like amidohydrolase